MSSWQKVESKGKKGKGGGVVHGSPIDGLAKPVPVRSAYDVYEAEEAKDYLVAYKEQAKAEDREFSVKDALSAPQPEIQPAAKRKPAAQPKQQAAKKKPQPVVQSPASAGIPGLDDLDLDKVRTEIQSLASVDKHKRCITLAMFLNALKPHSEGKGWEANWETKEPLSSLPEGLEKLVSDFIQDMPPSATARNLDLCLAEMLGKSANNATVWGFKLMIQLLAKYHGENAILKNNKSISALLANAFSAGGLPRAQGIVWACLQPVNFDQPQLAMHIWFRLLLPCVGNKPIAAPCVTSSLQQLLARRDVTKWHDVINYTSFFHLLDYTFPTHSQVDGKSRGTLLALYPQVKQLAFHRGLPANTTHFFPSFLARFKGSQSPEMREELLACIAACLAANPTGCFDQWHNILHSHLVQTVNVFERLEATWGERPVERVPAKQLAAFVAKAVKHTQSAAAAHIEDEEDRQTLLNMAQLLHARISAAGHAPRRTGGSTGGRSTLAIALYAMLAAGVLALAADLLLHNGVPTHSKLVYANAASQLARGLAVVEATFPAQLAAVRAAARPVTRAAARQWALVCNYARVNIPVLLHTVYHDIPLALYNEVQLNAPQAITFYEEKVKPTGVSIMTALNDCVDFIRARVNLESIFVYLV